MGIKYWRGTNSNNWSDAGNWFGGKPGSGDLVAFDGDSPVESTINVDEAASCAGISTVGLPDVGGLLELDGSYDLSVTGTVNLQIGKITGSYSGTLTLTGGSPFLGIYGLNCNIVINMTGTCTLVQDLNIPSNTLTITKGTFDAGGYAVTARSISSSGTQTRQIKFGGGLWTLTGYGTVWDCSTPTNLTLDISGGPTIKLTNNSANAKTFAGGSLIYDNFWDATLGAGKVTITGSNTFNNVKWNAGRTLQVAAGSTQTINSLSPMGTSGSHAVLTADSAAYFSINKSSGLVLISYIDISYCHGIGGATFIALNATDNGNNSGWTFNAASGPTFMMF